MKYLSNYELETISGGCIILIGNFLHCMKTILKYFKKIY